MKFKKFDNHKILEDMYEKGFSSNHNFLEYKDSIKLNEEVNSIFEKKIYTVKESYQNDFWDFKLEKNTLGKIQTKLIGQSAFIDKLISNLLNNEQFANILDNLIGKNRKLSTLNIRRANSHTNYDGIHTDHVGMLSISILTNNHNRNSPTTCLIPKSHRSKLLIEDKVENIRTELFAPFYEPLTGKTGSLSFFYNKTWHGMKKGNEVGTAIIFSFIAEGYEIYNDKKMPQKTFYGKNFIDVFNDSFFNLLDLNKNIFKNKITRTNKNQIDTLPKKLLIINFYFYCIIFLSKTKKIIKNIINN